MFKDRDYDEVRKCQVEKEKCEDEKAEAIDELEIKRDKANEMIKIV